MTILTALKSHKNMTPYNFKKKDDLDRDPFKIYKTTAKDYVEVLDVHHNNDMESYTAETISKYSQGVNPFAKNGVQYGPLSSSAFDNDLRNENIAINKDRREDKEYVTHATEIDTGVLTNNFKRNNLNMDIISNMLKEDLHANVSTKKQTNNIERTNVSMKHHVSENYTGNTQRETGITGYTKVHHSDVVTGMTTNDLNHSIDLNKVDLISNYSNETNMNTDPFLKDIINTKVETQKVSRGDNISISREEYMHNINNTHNKNQIDISSNITGLSKTFESQTDASGYIKSDHMSEGYSVDPRQLTLENYTPSQSRESNVKMVDALEHLLNTTGHRENIHVTNSEVVPASKFKEIQILSQEGIVNEGITKSGDLNMNLKNTYKKIDQSVNNIQPRKLIKKVMNETSSRNVISNKTAGSNIMPNMTSNNPNYGNTNNSMYK